MKKGQEREEEKREMKRGYSMRTISKQRQERNRRQEEAK